MKKFPPFEKNIEEFKKFIGEDTLVIHNAEFDIGFINNELKIAKNEQIKNKVVDTVKLARKVLNTRIANLDYLCKRFSIDTTKRKLHGALLDCELLSEVYLELVGGRQTVLELGNLENKDNKLKRNEPKEPVKILKILKSQEETINHKNFVADLKNALWHKVEY